MPTLGCVPYVNAIPLVLRFEEEETDVRVVYDVPSALPAMLDAGEANAVLCSSIEVLRDPSRGYARTASICTEDQVLSVRLFSNVPFERIGSLALDRSSMTSNALARIVLAERYRTRPKTTVAPPDLAGMLAVADACVMIGDLGMAARGAPYELDLGREWRAMTGLPFVWALWTTAGPIDPLLERRLGEARAWGVEELDRAIRSRGGADGMATLALRPLPARGHDLRFRPCAGGGPRSFRLDVARPRTSARPRPRLRRSPPRRGAPRFRRRRVTTFPAATARESARRKRSRTFGRPRGKTER